MIELLPVQKTPYLGVHETGSSSFVENLVIDLIAATGLEDRVEDIALLPRAPDGVSEIEIIHAISHGKVGAANGLLTLGGVKKPFSAFMEFTSTKATLVKSLTLYLASAES